MTASRSAGIVRRWVTIYTRGLPPDIRDARREEIEADLWSHAQDAEAFGAGSSQPSTEIFSRLVFGMWADITWRLEQSASRVRPGLRSLPMGTRIVAALAIIGGTAFAAAMLLWLPLVPPGARWAPPGTPESTVLGVLGQGGLILISVAIWGLLFIYNERVSGGAALVGAAAGLGGILQALGGYFGVFMLVAGSAVVAWDLSRFGALPRSLSIAHAAAAVALLIPLFATTTSTDTGPLSPAFIVLALPYSLTWIGIGVALLLRGGLPATDHPVPSPEHV